MTIPIQVVDGEGTPLVGISLNLASLPTHDGCEGGTETDSDGRFTWYGVTPNQQYRLKATDSANDNSFGTVKTEPFTGQPGETLPEVLIVCTIKGGFEGILTDEDGNPLTDFRCQLTATDTTGKVHKMDIQTDIDGRFTLLTALPEGTYETFRFGSTTRGFHEVGYAPGTELVRNTITDLGVITLAPTENRGS